MTAFMFLIYFLIVTPAGWLARICRDPMRRRWHRRARSYWTMSEAGG